MVSKTINLERLSLMYPSIELRSIGNPFTRKVEVELNGKKVEVEKTTTKFKVLCENLANGDNLDGDTSQFLDITVEGDISREKFKKGQQIDFLNAVVNFRATGKLSYEKCVTSLEESYRASSVGVIDEKTGELVDMAKENQESKSKPKSGN